MSKFKVSLEYKGGKIMPDVVGDGLTRLTIHFEDGTDMIITPDKGGNGRLTILGRYRKPGMVALSMTRQMGQANRVEITSRVKQRGD